MNEQDRKYMEVLTNAFRVLPADKKEYLIGVADGMAAMAMGSVTRDSPRAQRESA